MQGAPGLGVGSGEQSQPWLHPPSVLRTRAAGREYRAVSFHSVSVTFIQTPILLEKKAPMWLGRVSWAELGEEVCEDPWAVCRTHSITHGGKDRAYTVISVFRGGLELRPWRDSELHC